MENLNGNVDRKSSIENTINNNNIANNNNNKLLIIIILIMINT
jgi:hypothetical protein